MKLTSQLDRNKRNSWFLACSKRLSRVIWWKIYTYKTPKNSLTRYIAHLYRIVFIKDRRGGTSKVIYLINLNQQWFCDICNSCHTVEVNQVIYIYIATDAHWKSNAIGNSESCEHRKLLYIQWTRASSTLKWLAIVK